MNGRISIGVALLLGACGASAATIDIPDGQAQQFVDALFAAPGERSTLRLAARGTYVIPPDARLVVGDVRIEGRGARVTSQHARNVTVDESGRLEVHGVRFEKITLTNLGALSIDRSSFSAAAPLPFLLQGYAGVLTNVSGTLEVTNSTFHGMRAVGSTAHAAVVMNHADARLAHVTFADNRSESPSTGAPFSMQSFALLGDPAAAKLRVANSIIADAAIDACPPFTLGIESLGGNVFDDATCVLAPGDRIGDAALGAFGPHGGEPDTIDLTPGSAAIDAASPGTCPSTDARGFARDPSFCDAGAYELAAIDADVTADGLNGVWMSAAADGQYVSLQRLSDAEVLVVWYGFDAAGGNSLVYGVGLLDGQAITVPAATRSANGRLQPDGSVVGAEVLPWGALRIDLADCSHATLVHRRAGMNVDTGVPLLRLTVTHHIGCGP